MVCNCIYAGTDACAQCYLYKQMMGDYQNESKIYDIKPNEKLNPDNSSTSETLIIGVDKYGTDVFSLTVGKLEGLKTSIKKVFYGDEAEALYKKLINK